MAGKMLTKRELEAQATAGSTHWRPMAELHTLRNGMQGSDTVLAPQPSTRTRQAVPQPQPSLPQLCPPQLLPEKTRRSLFNPVLQARHRAEGAHNDNSRAERDGQQGSGGQGVGAVTKADAARYFITGVGLYWCGAVLVWGCTGVGLYCVLTLSCVPAGTT